MAPTPISKVSDAAVIMLVCKVAAWTIVRGRYADSPGEIQIFAWYGLAVLYGLAACAQNSSRQFLSRLALTLGALLSAAGAIASAGSSGVVTWVDWTLLGCTFAVRLGSKGHPRPHPGDNKGI